MTVLAVGVVALLSLIQSPTQCQPPQQTASALRPLVADWNAQWTLPDISRALNSPLDLVVGTPDDPTNILVSRVGSANDWSCGQMLHLNGGRLMDVRIRFASKLKPDVLAALQAYMTVVPESWRRTVMTKSLKKRVLSGRVMSAPFDRYQPLVRGAFSETLEIRVWPDPKLGTMLEVIYMHIEGHI